MKIVISSSRFAPEADKIKESLTQVLASRKIRVTDDPSEERRNRQDVAYIYFCADHQANQQVSMQDVEIDPEIKDADWVIVAAPLNHVGRYTMQEVMFAIDSFYTNPDGNPVLTLFNCTDYYSDGFPENRKEDKGFRNGTDHPVFDEVNEISIPRLKRLIEERIASFHQEGRELREVYLGEYKYDSERNGLKVAVFTAFEKNYEDKRYRFQKLIGLAQPGSKVLAEQLYFDKQRADYISNEYLPRESVDGNLEQALANQRKFIIVTGLPGSGKTRAVLKLLKQNDGHQENQYAFGALSDKNVVVVDQKNVRGVYERLLREKDHVDYLKRVKNQDVEPEDIYLICDQIKDVFSMFQNLEDLSSFFSIIEDCNHIKFIATSLPDAYYDFLQRWGDRPCPLPKKNDYVEDQIIEIPLISEDRNKDDIKNWIYFSLGVDSRVESIGDCIKELKNYKENIVKGLYKKYESDNTDKLPYLNVLMSSIQTVETFRRDPHLFLPLLIFQKEIIDMHELTKIEAIDITVKTINYLIKNNVIWAARFDDRGMAVGVDQINNNDFRLSPARFDDHKDDFICDEEIFLDTKISTKYIYGVNEIVWEYLKKVDANKHEHKLLFDYNKADEIVESAQLYYNAVKRASTLRRILSRVPYKDNRSEALSRLWSYVYEKIDNLNVEEESIDELNQVFGMLIGQSSGMDDIEEALELIEGKGITPNYSIIGQLYHFGKDKPEDIKKCIEEKVQDIRERYQMNSNTLFSFSREASFHELSFNDIIQQLKSTQFVDRKGNVLNLIDYAASCQNDKLVSSGFDRTFGLLAKMASNLDEWNQLLDLYVSCDLKMTRPAIFAFFTIMAKTSTEFNTRLQHLLSFLPQDKVKAIKDMIPEDVDKKDIGKYSGLIKDEDYEYLFFSSIECSDNYTQAKKFFDMYIKFVDKENPRMVSIVLHQVKNSDFQNALLFLQEVQQRYSDNEKPFSSIIYNNLLKRAPNVGEALAVLPNISNIQDFTLSNILLVLKNRKISNAFDEDELLVESKTDPKLFFYAYNVIMRKVFENHRRVPSPFVLGILFNFVSTRKQEDFIRNKYLQVGNDEKNQLIDLSTTIASIRIKKNYRSIGKPSDNGKIDSSWGVFNKCRSFYNAKKWYINSDLYSNMMRKIVFTFKDDEENFLIHMKALRDIIEQDDKRIIKDDYFLPNRYAYDPIWNQAIFDGDKVSEVFREHIKHSHILRVKALNKVLMSIDSAENLTFNKVWTFYQFMKDHYTINRRWKTLKPDIYTVIKSRPNKG